MNLISQKFFYELYLHSFWKSALNFKRLLDKRAAYDFIGAAQSGPLLLLGEGNLSFSLSISHSIGKFRSNITATTFESFDNYSEITKYNYKKLQDSGICVIDNIDATKLIKHFPNKKFKTIVFQFPNVGSRIPIHGRNPNHILVRRFLRSAASHLFINGCAVVTVVNSPYYDGAFSIDSVADISKYERPTAHPFILTDYPEYTHIKTKDDGVNAIDPNDDLVTYVFKRKPEL